MTQCQCFLHSVTCVKNSITPSLGAGIRPYRSLSSLILPLAYYIGLYHTLVTLCHAENDTKTLTPTVSVSLVSLCRYIPTPTPSATISQQWRTGDELRHLFEARSPCAQVYIQQSMRISHSQKAAACFGLYWGTTRASTTALVSSLHTSTICYRHIQEICRPLRYISQRTIAAEAIVLVLSST